MKDGFPESRATLHISSQDETTTKGACAHPDVALAAASGPSSTHMLHPTNKKAPMGWLLLLPQVPFPKEGKALCLSDGAVLQLN